MKREAGANPARTRRCKVSVPFHKCHCYVQREGETERLSPSQKTCLGRMWNHESLVSPYTQAKAMYH